MLGRMGKTGEHVAVKVTAQLWRTPQVRDLKVCLLAPDFRFRLLFCQVYFVDLCSSYLHNNLLLFVNTMSGRGHK